MSKEFDYYRITRKDSALIRSDDIYCERLYEEQAIENPQVMKFSLRKPIDRKPKMVDYHYEPNSIVSKKIYDVLGPLKIEGIQLIPAVIKGKDDKVFEDYWAIHIYKLIQCVDTNLSDCVINNGLGYVNKIVLDKNILSKVPLEKRLVFRLKEDFSYQLFHGSIVQKVMAVNPEGVRFVNIEEWNSGSHFK